MSLQPMSPNTYDILVIGAGGVGSAAAYHLAQDGKRVLLVEQFDVGHEQGSSHGGSRIFRHSHDTAIYGSLIPHAYQLWQRLEAESQVKLLTMTGGLDMGPPNDMYVSSCRATMRELGFPYQELTGREVRAALPQFQIPDDWIAVRQADAGILAATLCVQTMTAQAVHHGAELRERTKVVEIEPDGEGVRARLQGAAGEEVIHAGQAIITAGAWAPRFLRSLCGREFPLRVTHQQVAYFAVEKPAWFDAKQCPIFIFTAAPHLYGFPIHEKPGYVKIAKEFTDETDPDQPRTIHEDKLADLAQDVSRLFAGLRPEPVDAQVCLYTETPTRDFIIDRHPDHPQILFGAGFSGRGFKFVIATGRLLADLAESAPGEYNSPIWREQFRIENFAAVG